MARLNLTVPDDLFQRLEKHRDRLNMSRICAHALEKKVAELEKETELLQSLRRDVDEMHTMIGRLTDERDERLRHCFEQGIDSAQTWAQQAAYADLKSWCAQATFLSDKVRNLEDSPPLPDVVSTTWRQASEGLRPPMDLAEEKEFATGFYVTLIEHWRILEPRLS